jgi:carboxylesterase type B
VKKKLPVLVYFGGFAAGDGSESYDRSNMAKGIVTPTVNYRLGIWDFSHPN